MIHQRQPLNPGLPLDELAANLGNLSASDRTFAESLISQGRARPLSPKQAIWVEKLNLKAKPKNPATSGTAVSVNKADLFSGVRAMFDRNIAKGTKRLSIRMQTGAGDEVTNIRVSIASDLKRLHVSEPDVIIDDVGFEGRYFGFIDSDGEFHQSDRTPCDEAVMKALRELDADPMAVALSYGRNTGSCCICGAKLENSKSVELGIGPICLGKVGA